MSPEDFRTARVRLNLTQQELGQRLSEPRQRINYTEVHARKVPDDVERKMRALIESEKEKNDAASIHS